MSKRIIITGASRGIGKATALLLAKKGYDLFLVSSKSFEDLQMVKKEIEDSYEVDVNISLCDVSNAHEVEEVFSKIDDVYALINNAGISSVKLITDTSPEEWNKIIDTNLNSAFYTSRVIVPKMLCKHEGRIINVSSIWGNVGASMEVAYSTAKGGINSFTKALAKELAPSNIKVNAVAFGVIDTDMNACFSEEEMKDIINDIPMDRLGSADEAANMILSVLEAPDYLTGQIITMDGAFL